MIKLNGRMAQLTGYWPNDSPMEGGTLDRYGKPLCNLQRHILDLDPYCSVACDRFMNIAPGTVLWIPSLDAHYGKRLVFKICDTGSAFNHAGWGHLDICTATKTDSEDDFLNDLHEIVPLLIQ